MVVLLYLTLLWRHATYGLSVDITVMDSVWLWHVFTIASQNSVITIQHYVPTIENAGHDFGVVLQRVLASPVK